MVGAFKVRYSPAVAALLPREFRTQIITEVVASAERLAAGAGETAIYDVHSYRLKVIVRFAERCVWILTRDEAERAGLPDRPPFHTPN
jgi:hypothetical protein